MKSYKHWLKPFANYATDTSSVASCTNDAFHDHSRVVVSTDIFYPRITLILNFIVVLAVSLLVLMLDMEVWAKSFLILLALGVFSVEMFQFTRSKPDDAMSIKVVQDQFSLYFRSGESCNANLVLISRFFDLAYVLEFELFDENKKYRLVIWKRFTNRHFLRHCRQVFILGLAKR